MQTTISVGRWWVGAWNWNWHKQTPTEQRQMDANKLWRKELKGITLTLFGWVRAMSEF